MRVVLPDGTIVETSNNEEARELEEQYQQQGFEVIKAGDVVVITTKPKQA